MARESGARQLCGSKSDGDGGPNNLSLPRAIFRPFENWQKYHFEP
jgi:hypothetical protein